MSVGLAVIARDEEQNLPHLLASIEGAFDRVVLLDTGSIDATVEVFGAWAKQQPNMTYAVGRYEWIDDFADARTVADRLLVYGVASPARDAIPLVEWTCWADCDDEVINAKALRELAAQAPPEIVAIVFGYDYAQHPATGSCICHLRRERLVRAGASTWEGRVHEAQGFPHGGVIQQVPDEVCHWRHRKQASGVDAALASNDRNLRILLEWVEREPENARVLGYLGKEHAARGEHRVALSFYERYMVCDVEWGEERAQIGRHYACSLMALERFEEAEATALRVLAKAPEWPDTYLTLAECALSHEDHERGLAWARRTMELGAPQTVLIINPLDYTAYPRRLAAAALGNMQRFDEAVELGQQALSANPADEFLQSAWLQWRALAKREHTADTYCLAAEQLVAHDEQLKALILLEQCVPHFAIEHPRVVALRSFVRERLAWADGDAGMVLHYQQGGSKPEDFHDDETSDRIADSLPRVAYLLEGLREQASA